MAKRARASNHPRATGEAHVAVGQRLRAARLKVGMSQTDLGKALGVSFQQVQKYEKGVNRIDLNRMIEIAKALKINLEFFTGAVTFPRSEEEAQFDAIMASREGVQMIEAMARLTKPQRAFLVEVAQRLPRLVET